MGFITLIQIKNTIERGENMSMQQVTDATFDEVVLKSDKPVLVDFWAEWCGPCRALIPVLEEVAQEMGNEALIVKLNIDQNPDKTSQYGVRGIPTLILFNKGEMIQTRVGGMPKSKIIDWIREQL
jgi:thioredoxin 1